MNWRGLVVEIIRILWDHGYYRDNPWLQKIHAWWFEYWVQYKTKITMADVDRQAEELKAQWAKEEDAALLAKAQEENPNAHVEVVHPFDGADHKPEDPSIAAVKIEHEPDGSTAQQLLGGTLEIKAPWYEADDEATT